MGVSEMKVIGRDILRYGSVVSTNLVAKNMAQNRAVEGTVILAESQTKGRGRKNRAWHSPPGGLWFSMILYPELKPDCAMLATMCASVAVVEGIKRYVGVDTRIKWPNDVLSDGKKLAGILTETHATTGKLHYMVVGIGVNVNNDIPGELQDVATSLKYETDGEIDREKLFEVFLEIMDGKYALLREGRYDDIQDQWTKHCCIIGREIRVHEHDSVRTGLVKGIDEKGRLILETKDGLFTTVSGDVEIL